MDGFDQEECGGEGGEGNGLIAQEVESVYPALVEAGPGGAKAVNYTGLIAPR